MSIEDRLERAILELVDNYPTTIGVAYEIKRQMPEINEIAVRQRVWALIDSGVLDLSSERKLVKTYYNR